VIKPGYVLLVVGIGVSVLAFGRSAPAGEQPLRVTTVAGQAEVQKAGASGWSVATLRAELEPGDAARTLAGRLTLRTGSGQAVRLAPSSRVALLAAASDQPTRVRLDAGSAWAAVMGGSPPHEQLEVQARTLTVTIRGSGVDIALARDGSVLVRVYHGAAECAGGDAEPRWRRMLGDQQELSVSAAGTPGDVRKLDRGKLDAAWAKWNEEQDLAGGYGGKPPAR
jgi:FecR protein